MSSGGPLGPPVRFPAGQTNPDGEQDAVKQYEPTEKLAAIISDAVTAVSRAAPVRPARRGLTLKGEVIVMLGVAHEGSSSTSAHCG